MPMEWKSDIERLQEDIIEAINYFKDHKKKGPTSEDILRFVNSGHSKADFALFKEAMRELKLQRRINNEMRNGTFVYYIPRVPEITLKVNRPEKKENPPKKSSVLPIFPVEIHRERSSHKVLGSYRETTAGKKGVEHLTGDNRVLIITTDDDSYEYYEDDDDDEDVGTLEKFIDKMMDRIDDVVVANEPATNILSLYEQRIFDLKSEVLFLRKLTTSNNTLLMDELQFLRTELEAKNHVIEKLSNQIAVTEFDKKRYAKAELQYEIGYSNKPSGGLGEVDIDNSKALTIGSKLTNEEILKRSGWESDSWLREIAGIASKENKGRHVGFSSFNILDHLKTGITPRHKGMSAHVGEHTSPHELDFARLFGNFFGLMMETPLKKMNNGVVIPELGKKPLLPPINLFTDVLSQTPTNVKVAGSGNTTTVQPSEKELNGEKKGVLPGQHFNENKSSKIDNEELERYRAWLSLDIMDQMISANTKNDHDDNLKHFSGVDMNLLSICEDMSEKVNTISSKLRPFCDQRNINYDSKMDEPCLSLNKLPLISNANNLLTNAYINHSIAT